MYDILCYIKYFLLIEYLCGAGKTLARGSLVLMAKLYDLTTSISPILDVKKLSIKDLVIGICQSLYSSPG